MRDLLILGTCPHDQEAACFVERINRVRPTWNLLGHLTVDAAEVGTRCGELPVLGDATALANYPQAMLLPGLPWPALEPDLYARSVSVVDPGSVVCATAQVGRGCVIYPHCFVGANAVLGDRVMLLHGCSVGHDARLEDRVVLTSGVQIAGYVTIEADCEIGQGATVRQKLRIGRGSLVGMGAVVVKDVPAESVVVGNPARWLRANRKS